jgi:hypothetical protein
MFHRWALCALIITVACSEEASGSSSSGGAPTTSSAGGATNASTTDASTSTTSTTTTSTTDSSSSSTGTGGAPSPSTGPDATAAVRFTGGDVCERYLHQLAAAPDGWVIAGWVRPSESDLTAPCSIQLGSTTIQASQYAQVRIDFVAKLSTSGEVLWVVPFDSHTGSGIEDVAVDASGDIHLVGRIHHAGEPAVSWFKLDELGQPLLVDSSGIYPSPQHVVVTPSGELLFGASGVVRRTTADGVVLASGTFSFGVSGDTISGLTLASDGSVFVSGPAYDSQTGSDVAVAKYDSNLLPVWSSTLGGANDQDVHGLASDGAGGVVIAGNFSSQMVLGGETLTGSATGYMSNGFVARLDGSGTTESAIDFGTSVVSSCCDGPSVATWPNGDWVVGGGGSFTRTNGELDFGLGPIPVVEDAFLARWSSDGTIAWGRVFPGRARITEVAIASDGSVGVVGKATSAVDFGTGSLPEPTGFGDVFFATFPEE